jgi:methionyl-tRNA formyltransferase
MAEDINAGASLERLARHQADLSVVCDYGRILAAGTLATTRLGGINLHGSLLPSYRGAAPVNWAIWHGERATGVSVIHMTPQLDAGPIVARQATPIGDDEDAVALEARLAQLGVESVRAAIAQLESWDGQSPLGTPQDSQVASRAPRLKKTDGRVDWSRSAVELRNQVRALKPWPGTFTHWTNKNRDMRLILDQVEVELDASPSAPGNVVCSEKDRLWVMTGHGALAIQRIKPAGKRTLGIAEFLRGYPIQVGDRFN